MKIKYIFTRLAILILVFHSKSFSCLRVDEIDPPSILAASQFEANQDLFQTVGVVKIGSKLATAIALDPWTVLTAAHVTDNTDQSGKFYIDLYDESLKRTNNFYYDIEKIIRHPSFERLEQPNLALKVDLDKKVVNFIGVEVSFDDLSEMNFAQYVEKNLSAHMEFDGIDLAILKLKYPLPKHLPFPMLTEEKVDVTDKLTTPVGYGLPCANNLDTGAVPFNVDLLNECKHAISVQVSPHMFKEQCVFISQYKGKFINGLRSFIPSKSMTLLAGLPVSGDSGSPLFLNNQLCGVFSSVLSINPVLNENLEHRELFKNIQQPIFAVWTDITDPSLLEWIKKNKDIELHSKFKIISLQY